MRYIHFPTIFANDPVVSDTILPPVNEEQAAAHHAATSAYAAYLKNPETIGWAFQQVTSYNLLGANRTYMPFAVLDTDETKAESAFVGYTRLIIARSGHDLDWRSFDIRVSQGRRAKRLREQIFWLKCYLCDAQHYLDHVALQIALADATMRLYCIEESKLERKELRRLQRDAC